MKQAISGAMADRKRTMKIEPKNKGKNGVQKRVPNPPESGLENPPKNGLQLPKTLKYTQELAQDRAKRDH
jgi:hypothetical protein